MSTDSLPLILEPEQLEMHLQDDSVVVVDLCKKDNWEKHHIPGAVHIEFPEIVRVEKPVGGLLPAAENLSAVLSKTGIAPEHHVVAYDDEGGGKASRLLWTLDAAGHRSFSLLNGGLHAWANENHALDTAIRARPATSYPVTYNSGPVATREYILKRLEDENTCLLDARSANEFNGVKNFSSRPGHIPGAINLEWTWAMDQTRNLRLKDTSELTRTLESHDITPDREVIVYCQTHHRSAHTYIMLKSLGYPSVKGYEGSWSDWGNQPDTPVAL